jgi:hypothetical protein
VRKLLIACAVAALAAAGCYGSTEPSYRPGDASQLVQAVTRRGVTVAATVSGDSACPADASLTNNALHLTVSDPTGGMPRDAYVYVFREKTWDASRAQIDQCQAEYAAAHPDQAVNRLDIPIYRVLGAGWSPALTEVLTAAVTEASHSG